MIFLPLQCGVCWGRQHHVLCVLACSFLCLFGYFCDDFPLACVRVRVCVLFYVYLQVYKCACVAVIHWLCWVTAPSMARFLYVSPPTSPEMGQWPNHLLSYLLAAFQPPHALTWVCSPGSHPSHSQLTRSQRTLGRLVCTGHVAAPSHCLTVGISSLLWPPLPAAGGVEKAPPNTGANKICSATL